MWIHWFYETEKAVRPALGSGLIAYMPTTTITAAIKHWTNNRQLRNSNRTAQSISTISGILVDQPFIHHIVICLMNEIQNFLLIIS